MAIRGYVLVETEVGRTQAVGDAIRHVTPELAQITAVEGVTVTGTSGVDSACAYCTIEIFLDDTNAVIEALQSLDMVTATATGAWTATLPTPLEEGQALRTMRTVPDQWTITNLDGGTTSNLSVLYGLEYEIFLPLLLRNP